MLSLLYVKFTLHFIIMLALLPHKFKKAGALMAPLGFLFWSLMQLGYVTKLCHMLGISSIHTINVAVAFTSFVSFLFGMYALSFSKEKVEDELTNKIRLESLQFGALVQIIFLIAGLLIIGFMKNPPNDGGLEIFLVAGIFLFWLAYIIRFNYILIIGIYKYEK